MKRVIFICEPAVSERYMMGKTVATYHEENIHCCHDRYMETVAILDVAADERGYANIIGLGYRGIQIDCVAYSLIQKDGLL